MKLATKATLSLIVGGLLASSPAAAFPLLFSFTGQNFGGPITASFQLDSNPTPSRVNDQAIIQSGQIFFDNVSGIFNGNAETASSISFGTNLLSQFQISGTSLGFAQFGGQTVFSGSLSNPVFAPGTFNFTGFTRGTLTVSEVTAAVPEPATWAMMIGGFALVGSSMRRKKMSLNFA